jgi:hypothetical protein
VWVWVWLSGCGQPACEQQPAGDARDRCVHAALLDPAHVPAATEVVRLAALIQDPLVRDASVLAWVSQNRGAVTPDERKALCGSVSAQERDTCERRLSAVHLLR